MVLQWGRGCSAAEGKRQSGILPLGLRFNGAAAVQPRKAMESCAHRCMEGASMGPRLFSRGRNDADPARTADHGASMGPRLFSRGRSARKRRRVEKTSGFNGAAAVQPRKANTAWKPFTIIACFNGAAAVQPRKVGSNLHDAAEYLTLQWGRGCSAAEGALYPKSWIAVMTASMGPRLFSRGRSAATP